MFKCKITVLKRMANQDLAEAYMGEEYLAKGVVPCTAFEDGQAFVIEGAGEVPGGFCAWAWSDIHKEILAIMSGGDINPWVRQKGTAIACCTDGFRPVVFKIERVE